MLGRVLLSLDCLALLLGAPLADYGPTHIFNDNWAPHAKFHCGQTITLSVLLGVATTFLTWRPYLVRTSDEVARESIHAAAFTGSIYWIAGMAAILYPGTMGLDPEFGGPGFPQAWIFVASAALGLGGAWLESRRQGKAMTKQA